MAIFSPAILHRLRGNFAKPYKSLQLTHLFPELAEREREVLTLIAQGYTNFAINEQLVLIPKTVRNHVSSMFSKLQMAVRAEAIIRARDAGLTKDTP